MKTKLVLLLGTVGSLLGGLDSLLILLLGLMLIDIATGLMVAFADVNTFKFKIMFIGGCKKIFILLLVMAGVLIEPAVGKEGIRVAIISYYSAYELFSIINNADKLELPVPKKLKIIMELLRDEENEG
jgi:toxin secretion/phage lysis holin